jgi:hypothetical protein
MEKILRSILADISDIKATQAEHTRRFDRIDQPILYVATEPTTSNGQTLNASACKIALEVAHRRIAYGEFIERVPLLPDNRVHARVWVYSAK